MTQIRRLPWRPRNGPARRAVGLLGIVSMLLGALLGLGVVSVSPAAAADSPGFHTDPGNSYTAKSDLNVQCPNGIEVIDAWQSRHAYTTTSTSRTLASPDSSRTANR